MACQNEGLQCISQSVTMESAWAKCENLRESFDVLNNTDAPTSAPTTTALDTDPASSYNELQGEEDPEGDVCPATGRGNTQCRHDRKCPNCTGKYADGRYEKNWHFYDKAVKGKCKTQIAVPGVQGKPAGGRDHTTCTSCYEHVKNDADKAPLAFVMLRVQSRTGECIEFKKGETHCSDLDSDSPWTSPLTNNTMCTKVDLDVQTFATGELPEGSPEETYFAPYKLNSVSGINLSKCAIKKESICRPQGNHSNATTTCVVNKIVKCVEFCKRTQFHKAIDCSSEPCHSKYAKLICKKTAMMQ